MKKDNKTTTYILLIIVITLLLLILMVIAWLFLSKMDSPTAKGNTFGKFKKSKDDTSIIPSSLKWNDPFKNKNKDDEKPQGSYLHYLSEQNKNK